MSVEIGCFEGLAWLGVAESGVGFPDYPLTRDAKALMKGSLIKHLFTPCAPLHQGVITQIFGKRRLRKKHVDVSGTS
jgi:hypothetical protein